MHAKLTLPLLTKDTVPAKSREFLSNAHKTQGFVPNMYAEMAHSLACSRPTSMATTGFARSLVLRRPSKKSCCWSSAGKTPAITA